MAAEELTNARNYSCVSNLNSSKRPENSTQSSMPRWMPEKRKDRAAVYSEARCSLSQGSSERATAGARALDAWG
ncbi:hypothetical protein EVAR_17551_1 [Eumeta japonica]|uniref:Uncharacterized protein n=1 Tax=Eumeta variegata TaxID=151549 RepID=A0A4C1WTP2_EUMVA|nr:hypothetical protein EVAR_17551_1 [Eumeta japonica]